LRVNKSLLIGRKLKKILFGLWWRTRNGNRLFT
jgi:hypothetical protein